MKSSDVSETDKVETPSVVCMDGKLLQGFKNTSGTLKSNQDLDSGGVESRNIIKDDVPIALWTKHNYRVPHPTKAMKQMIFSTDNQSKATEKNNSYNRYHKTRFGTMRSKK